MVSAGSVIGSGWPVGALHASEAAGPTATISWGIGAVLVIGIALIYAELGAAYPGLGQHRPVHLDPCRHPSGFFCGTFSYRAVVAIAPVELEAGVRTEHLAERFGVSGEAICRDLIRLEREGLLNRVYGGTEPTKRSRASKAAFGSRILIRPSQQTPQAMGWSVFIRDPYGTRNSAIRPGG
jgi:hypothetical protein